MSDAVLSALLAALAATLLLSPCRSLRRLQRPVPYPRLDSAERPARPAQQRILIAGLVGVVVAVGVGGLLGVVAGGSLGVATFLLLRRSRPNSLEQRLPAELPDAADFLAICIEVGLPLHRAVESVAQISPPATRRLLGDVAAQLHLGRDASTVWADLANHPAWGPVAVDVARSHRSGTSLAATLKVHAGDARQEVRDTAIKRARSVGVRSVLPLMLCFLPAFILVGVVPIVAGLLGSFLGG